MLAFNGRVTGISGILGGLLPALRGDRSWRIHFLLGLFLGGFLISQSHPSAFQNSLQPTTLVLIIAGVLVGFGTSLGSGCTSGHGVCGVSRLSIRSLLATGTFMAFGMLTVTLLRRFF